MYGLGSKLAEWRSHGLISEEQSERIAAFEAARARPKLALAMTVLGAFTAGVGVIAIVAANWDAIPVDIRLGLHVLINLVIAGAVWHWAGRSQTGVRVEAGVVLLSLSTLALIAHVGQSFQLQGSVSGLMGGWLLLVTPVTIALSRSSLSRWTWTLGLLIWAQATWDDHRSWLLQHGLSLASQALFVALLYSARAVGPWRSSVWGRHFAHLGIGLPILAATVMLMTGSFLGPGAVSAERQSDAAFGAVFGLIALALAHFAVPADRRGVRGWLGLAVMLAPPLVALAICLSGWIEAVVTGLVFCLYWIGLARLAMAGHALGWFRVAVSLIAVRVFFVYLDAAGGLMATGLGLVLAGALLMVLALAAWKVMDKAGGGERS